MVRIARRLAAALGSLGALLLVGGAYWKVG
jgi:hypothetical protein